MTRPRRPIHHRRPSTPASIALSTRDHPAPPAALWRRRAAGLPGLAALLALCAVIMLPGLRTIGPIDRDESRFAQASRQMFEALALPEHQRDPAMHAGGLILPMVGDRPRINKPPLIYWLQTAAAATLTAGDPARDAIWMYRVPSVLCATLAVLGTWWLGRRLFDPRAAWLAAAFLAVCPVVAFDAHQARADQLLLACTLLAMAGLWGVWSTRHRAVTPLAAPLMLWIGIALGLLAKGPITPMVALLAALALAWTARDARWLVRTRPLLGLALIALLVAPWVIAVGQRLGWADLARLAYDETLGRAASPKEGHWGPPGYHLVLLPALFWPGSLLTALALARAARRALVLPAAPTRRARWRARRPRRDAELFLLCWIVPAWLVFELSTTKLPHYTLPLYPALALLSARAVLGGPAAWGLIGRSARLGFIVWAALGVLLLAAAPALVGIFGFGSAPPQAAVLAVAGIGMTIITLRAAALAWRGHLARAQLASLAVPVIAAPLIFALLAPAILARPSLEAAAILHDLDPARTRPVAAVGYHEDSLVFLTRGRLTRLDAPALDPWLDAHPRALVVLPERDALARPDLRPAGFASGLNLGTGRIVRLVVAEGATPPDDAP